MKKSDFTIGKEFFTATGRWQCSDIGTRVVAAFKKDMPDMPGIPAAGWYVGPPYAVAEEVFDEDDQEGCVPTYEEAVEAWGEEFVAAEAERGEVTVPALQFFTLPRPNRSAGVSKVVQP